MNRYSPELATNVDVKYATMLPIPSGKYIRVADIDAGALECGKELIELAAMRERAEAGTSKNSEFHKLACVQAAEHLEKHIAHLTELLEAVKS